MNIDSGNASAVPPEGKSASSTLSLALMATGILAVVAGAVYLLKTNPHVGVWQQAYDPTGRWRTKG